MLRRYFALATIAMVVSILGAADVMAASRTFVASHGVDSNPCSATQPCRGFQAAINAVAAGGEVVALDSAGYGAMSISKSVSVIVPPGVHAGLSPAAGIPLPGYPGESGVVLIDIANTDVVVLRGLNLNRQGNVNMGIAWVSNQGGTVHVESTIANGFPQEGVFIQAATGTLYIKDSELRGNNVGLWARGDRGRMTIFADHLRAEGNTFAGLAAEGDVRADVRDSLIVGNLYGVWMSGSSGGSSVLLTGSTVGKSDTAFYFAADISMTVGVSACTLVDLTHGYHEFSPSQNIYTYGNNTVVNVGAPGPFNGTRPLQ
jgi:hypothetical protein